MGRRSSLPTVTTDKVCTIRCERVRWSDSDAVKLYWTNKLLQRRRASRRERTPGLARREEDLLPSRRTRDGVQTCTGNVTTSTIASED